MYGRTPGGKSRWPAQISLFWEPLRPELVVEVSYEHVQSGRFRHMEHFRCWRKDRKPASCTFAQLKVVPPEELKAIRERSLDF
jgi:ATP-dependent DNA ligase